MVDVSFSWHWKISFTVLQVQTRMFSQTRALFNKRINKKGELFEILQLLDYVFLNGFK